MSSSAAKKLLDLLAPRFALLTTANGYVNQLVEIKRATQKFSDLADDLPMLNYFHGETVIVERQYNTEKRDLAITLEAYTRTVDDPFTDTASLLSDELEMVMHRTTGQPGPGDESNKFLLDADYRNVGEIFIDAIVPAIGEGQAPYCGTVISGRIRYQIAVGCPSDLLEI